MHFPAVLIACIGTFSFLLPSLAHAWQWPLAKAAIIHGFGGNTGRGFRLDDFLSGMDETVHPIADGRVVFVHTSGGRPSKLPSPLGDFIVVQHDQGFRSVYGHLKAGSIPEDLSNVHERTAIGVTGQSGETDQPGVSLRVIDMKRDRVVNPVAVLPNLPDRLDPEVHALYLKQAATVPFEDGMTVAPGRWGVVADVADQSPDVTVRSPIAPYELELSLDGKRVSRILFEDLRFRNGELFLDSSYRWNYSALYDGPFLFQLGESELHAGTHKIRLRAVDFAGNETIIDHSVVVQEPAPVAPAAAEPTAPVSPATPPSGTSSTTSGGTQ